MKENPMKRFYFVLTVQENGKKCSYVESATENSNLLSTFNVRGLVNINIFPTQKKAREVAQDWNRIARDQGRYMYA